MTLAFNTLIVPSIDQNGSADALPDFRNLGVALRIVLLANLAGFAAVLILSEGVKQLVQRVEELAAVLEPVLLLSLLTLYALSKWLSRLRYSWGIAVVMLLEIVWTTLVLKASLFPGEVTTPFGLARAWMLCTLLTGFIAAYFFWRMRAYSPALNDARLQALQARIRPHFLFNSLNAVLSLIRREPQRAEEALEDLAELFRALMHDNRRLTTFADELALCRQYLAL